MAKRRRKKARKVFPAKYNASRVNVGLGVETFKTSVKTGHIEGRHIEVFRYRQRGSTPANEWLEGKFKDHNDPNKQLETRLRRKQLREEEEARSILDFLDLYNKHINAELSQTSWKHQHIERFWYKNMYHPDKDCKLRLYMTRNTFFFVEENTKKKLLRKSFEYSTRERAEEVYTSEEGIIFADVYQLPEQ